jgi:oxygen-independent coproporphyrinogen III oxidase
METALYVHLPFCRKRCTYCAFAISTDQRLEGDYFRALLREVEIRGNGEEVETIYLGGGTPSRSSPEHLRRLFAAIRERWSTEGAVEVSFEANPEDVTEPFLDLVEALGVTRLSLGVQSLDDRELYPLGRGHAGERARQAVRAAVQRDLRISADLILGLPQQTVESFRASLHDLLDEGVGHISVYMLDMEEGSPLQQQVQRGKVVLPVDDLVADLYLEMVRVCAERGLHQYEISNFAREGEESRHNLRYWRRQPYVGLGLGAHSFDGARRFANSRDMAEYMTLLEEKGSARTFIEELDEGEVQREELFLALRQARGIAYSELQELTGGEGQQWVSRGISEGWLQQSGERVAFTPAGFLLSSELLSQLF